MVESDGELQDKARGVVRGVRRTQRDTPEGGIEQGRTERLVVVMVVEVARNRGAGDSFFKFVECAANQSN